MTRRKRLLVIGTEGHFGREVLHGIHAYCSTHGSWAFRLEDDNSLESVRQARVAIDEWKADGIVAAIRRWRVEKLVRTSSAPVVNISGLRELSFPAVLPDYAAIGRLVARHFLNSGFRNFAFCCRRKEVLVERMCDAFVQELAGRGMKAVVLISRCRGLVNCQWASIRRETARWLKSLPKPVALMCPYDMLGRDVIEACQILGLRVPEDVAVVGFGNDEILCKVCDTPLSSVDGDFQKVGYEAAKLVDSLIKGGKAPPGPILVAPRAIVTRQSSDVVAIEDPDVSAAVRFIRDHAGEPVGVKSLLLEVPLARRTLEQRFVKALGRTIKAEFARVRVEKAKGILAATESPIPAVAQAVGFLYRSRFETFFRNQAGLTPTQYRRASRMGDTHRQPGIFAGGGFIASAHGS